MLVLRVVCLAAALTGKLIWPPPKPVGPPVPAAAKPKVKPAAEVSGIRYERCEPGKAGVQVRPFGSPRNDGESRVPACAGMTACSRIETAHRRCAP